MNKKQYEYMSKYYKDHAILWRNTLLVNINGELLEFFSDPFQNSVILQLHYREIETEDIQIYGPTEIKWPSTKTKKRK